MKNVMLLGLLVLFSQLAKSQQHIHGQGQLLIAQENHQWQLQFILPAADLLGFEYAPETKEQKEHFMQMKTKVENIENMVTLDSECKTLTMNHTLKKLNHSRHSKTSEKANHKHNVHNRTADIDTKHDNHHMPEKHNHKHKENLIDDLHEHHQGHSDVTVTYVVSCEDKVSEVQVVMFGWSSSLQKLETMWITDNGQGSVNLTANSNVLRLQ